MKAAVCTSGVITLRAWREPAPGPGEPLRRVRGCGLCGSDILKVTAAAPDPAVLGHEVVGDVVEVGAGVHRFAAGHRLAGGPPTPRSSPPPSHYCRRGSHSMCRHFKRINLDPGGFAELVRVPAPNVEHAAFRLPAAIADETASFTEPLACCLRAVKRARIAPGGTARVRDGGALHYFAGGAGESLPLSLAALYHRELTLSATYSSSPAELAEAVELLGTRRVGVDGLISHRLPLGPRGEGVELMRRHEAVKVYVTP